MKKWLRDLDKQTTEFTQGPAMRNPVVTSALNRGLDLIAQNFHNPLMEPATNSEGESAMDAERLNQIEALVRQNLNGFNSVTTEQQMLSEIQRLSPRLWPTEASQAQRLLEVRNVLLTRFGWIGSQDTKADAPSTWAVNHKYGRHAISDSRAKEVADELSAAMGLNAEPKPLPAVSARNRN